MQDNRVGPTTDQLERLEAIEAKLLDVALDECDPDTWTDQEKAAQRAAEMEAEGQAKEAKVVRQNWKGERYWEKKNANQTLAIITRIVLYRQRLEEVRHGAGRGLRPEDEAKVAADMKTAEQIVKKRLALVKKRAC